MRHLAWFVLLAALTGCGSAMDRRDAVATSEIEKSAEAVEIQARELRTLSALAKLEEALTSYVNTEKKIPESLDVLIPKYLAEIPAVEVNVRGHRDSADVRLYKTDILRDRQIDGTRLKDSGRWGYVFNDRQVVVFVDCTHQSKRGTPWYLERNQ